MRAFIALLLPSEVTDELDAFLEPRRDALAPRGHWRWTRPEHRHLTLAFLPELDEWREEALVEAGEEFAGRRTPVDLTLAGAGAFSAPERARVLWAAARQVRAPGERPATGADQGVHEDEEPALLADWARGLRAVASRAGAQVDGTRFTAHVTLARSARGPQPAGHLLQALDTLHTSGWTADEICLIRSELGQGPRGTPRYEVRHRWAIPHP